MRRRDFTLVEMLLVLMLIALLATLVTPVVTGGLARARESTLRADLYALRKAIDDYYADTGSYPSELEELVTKQVAEAVNRAIDQLPEDLRTAIVLRELEGLSYEEIAESMQCPIGTVRSRIFRAREAIALELRPILDIAKDKRW